MEDNWHHSISAQLNLHLIATVTSLVDFMVRLKNSLHKYGHSIKVRASPAAASSSGAAVSGSYRYSRVCSASAAKGTYEFPFPSLAQVRDHTDYNYLTAPLPL